MSQHGNLAVGTQFNKAQQYSHTETTSTFSQQGTKPGNLAFGSQGNMGSEMTFSNIGGSVGQQEINAGNVAGGNLLIKGQENILACTVGSLCTLGKQATITWNFNGGSQGIKVRGFSVGNNVANVAEQGYNVGNVAVGNNLQGNIFSYTLGSLCNLRKLENILWNIKGTSHGIKGHGVKFGSNISIVGHHGANKGNVAVGSQGNKGTVMHFGNTAGIVCCLLSIVNTGKQRKVLFWFLACNIVVQNCKSVKLRLWYMHCSNVHCNLNQFYFYMRIL